jgi:hypothetical protein
VRNLSSFRWEWEEVGKVLTIWYYLAVHPKNFIHSKIALSSASNNTLMKKFLQVTLLVIALLAGQSAKSQSACSYTSTTSGNTATFNFLWFATTITIFDSVRFNYGDGNSQLYMMPISTTTHTYANPGWYNVCLTQYTHQLGTTTVNTCTYCDSIQISGPLNIASATSDWVQAYPNPINNQSFYIQTNSALQTNETYITDMLGRKQYFSMIEKKQHVYELNASQLTDGFYLVHVEDAANRTSTIRVQVKR